jgi:type IV secretory pathway TraG/TraD family ATPase VirD4
LAIAALISAICRPIIAGASSAADHASGDAMFFASALNHMIINIIDLCKLAGRPLAFPTMRRIVDSAALSRAEVESTLWQTKSFCMLLLKEAKEKLGEDPDDDSLAVFRECESYWLRAFVSLSDRTRSVILLYFSMLARPLLTPPLRGLFSTDTNVSPADILSKKGVILLVDIPRQEYFEAGDLAAAIWLRSFQNAVMRRENNDGRLAICWIDECQQFVSSNEAAFMATARSQGCGNIFLTQSRESLQTALGSEAQVDTMLASMSTIIACRSSSVSTNEWLSATIGKRYIDVQSSGVSLSFGKDNQNQPNSSSNTSQQLRRYVEPREFSQLITGGAKHDYRVTAIAYKSGELMGKEKLPFLRLSFNQRA